ncbi:MAG: hypothetical protein M1282_18575 [Chloroflexi bacterium]|nr:hypothetical protein [Chloroflexota bacterium]
MKRILSFLFLLAFLTACAPNVVPIPVTQGPTLPPPTSSAPVIAAPGLTTVHMVDANSGWGVTDTAVVRTEDGGVTWHEAGPSGVTTLGYTATSNFLDAQHGWILITDPKNPLAGTMYRTSDGGTTWTSSSVPFGSGDLHFLDADKGWIMASLGAGAGSMGVAIFQTTDAGATWTQTYTNDPNQPNAGSSLPLGGLKDGLTPLDMQNAFIGGVIYTPGEIYLYKTSDGGHSWSQITVTAPVGYEQADFETIGPTFVSAKDAYLPVHASSQYGVMLVIYVSHDGGATWVLTPKMIPQGGSMDFVSPTDGFVWNGTTFYVTHDGAQTWTTITPDVAFGDNFAGMDFVSPTTGFVLTNDVTGTRRLYKTTNSGTNWTQLGQ